MNDERASEPPQGIERVGAKWRASGAGDAYRSSRFRSRAARERDPKLVAALLRRCGAVDSILDVPCGAGRLRPTLRSFAPRVVGVDVSAAMLAAAAEASESGFAQASVDALPFAERCFDVVVCCRLLHHLHDADAVDRAATELVRVSRRFVIASFWDAAALPSWRVRLGLKRAEGPLGRVAKSRTEVANAFERAGGVVRELRTSLRFVSQQTFVLVERST